MQPTIARVTRSGLRSDSDTTSYATPRLRTKFGERAFSSDPAAWNSLPAIMATQCNRAGHYIFALWFLSFYLLFSSPNLSRRRLGVYRTSTHGVALVGI